MKVRSRVRWAGLAGAVVAGCAAVFAFGPSASKKARAEDPPGLTQADIRHIVEYAVHKADSLNSPLRSLPAVQRTCKMQIAIVDRAGNLLQTYTMRDAWEGSLDIAIAKAHCADFFSSDQNAYTSGFIGQLSRPDKGNGAPLYLIEASNQVGITGEAHKRNGLITFPGGISLYKNNHLVGGLGISGDTVENDYAVAKVGATGFLAGKDQAKSPDYP